MRVLITGASGFLGRSLIQHLINTTDFDLFALNRVSAKKFEFINSACRLNYLHYASLSEIEPLLMSTRPEIVIHCATYFHSEHKASDIQPMVESVIEFPTTVVDALAKVDHSTIFINVGTSWQHFKNKRHNNPNGLHAALKSGFEEVLKYYLDSSKVSVVTLKLFDTYGPGDVRKKLIGLLFDAAVNNSPIDLTAGEQYIDIVFINDVCECFRLICMDFKNKKELGGSFGVSSGSEITVRDIVSEVINVTGADPNLFKFGKRPYRNREVMNNWREGMETYRGWTPKVSLRSGLEISWKEHLLMNKR